MDSCKKCGDTNFHEEGCELFCLSCGFINSISSTQVVQTLETEKANWALSIRSQPKSMPSQGSGSESSLKLQIINRVFKNFCFVLSTEFDCPFLTSTLTEKWETYKRFNPKMLDENGILKIVSTKAIILKLSYLAIRDLDLPYTFADLKKLILYNKLEYFAWKNTYKKLEKSIKLSIRKDYIIEGDKFYSQIFAHKFTRLFDVLPPPLSVNYLKRFLIELKLTRLYKSCLCFRALFLEKKYLGYPNRTSKNVCITSELFTMSIIVYAIRWYFTPAWYNLNLDSLKTHSLGYVKKIEAAYQQWLEDVFNLDSINDDAFLSLVFTKRYYKKAEKYCDINERILRTNSLKYKFDLEIQDDEMCESGEITLEKLTKPLRKLIYQLPRVRFDSTNQFNLLLLRASHKLCVSKEYLLSVLEDVETVLQK